MPNEYRALFYPTLTFVKFFEQRLLMRCWNKKFLITKKSKLWLESVHIRILVTGMPKKQVINSRKTLPEQEHRVKNGV